jgi:hypothetical protein
MTSEPHKIHYNSQDLMGLLEGTLEDPMSDNIASHIAECDDCAELLGKVAGTALMFETWNARTHAQVELLVAASQGIAAAEKRPEFSQWASRFRVWREQKGSRVQAAIRVAASSVSSALSFVGIPETIQAAQVWTLAPAVASFDLAASGEAVQIATIKGLPDARIEVHEEKRRGGLPPDTVLRISLPPDAIPSGAGQMVLLVDFDNRETPRALMLEAQPSGVWRGEFRAIPPGRYALFLEALDAQK